MGGEELKERYHGGDVLGFASRFGLAPESILDFSSNINPYGPPPGVVRAVSEGSNRLAPYPDRHSRAFRSALSRTLGVPFDSLLAANGAAEAFFLTCYALRPSRVLIPVPSFGGYQAAVLAAGVEPDRFWLWEKHNFRLEPDLLGRELGRARREGRGYDLVFLANPNNPTGQLIGPAELDRMLDACRSFSAAVLLDEAFLDFCPGEPELTRVHRAAKPDSGLLVARSMTKFYSLAGLRLGYLVAGPEMIRRLEVQRDPWSVNALAQAAGEAALVDLEFPAMTRELTARARESLAAGLAALGLRPLESAANFLLVDVRPAGLDSALLQEALAPAGIMVRDCSSFDGLGSGWVRLAVRKPEDNERLRQAVGRLLS